MILPLVVALSLHAEPPTAPETMKGLVKDALEKPAGPDLTREPFTPDTIKKVVLTYQPQIQGCYEEHLAGLKEKQKVPQGLVKTAFVITEDGLVKGAKVDRKGSTLKNPQLHDCVVAVLSTMTFPKPPDGKARPIEFPFNLKPVH